MYLKIYSPDKFVKFEQIWGTSEYWYPQGGDIDDGEEDLLENQIRLALGGTLSKKEVK